MHQVECIIKWGLLPTFGRFRISDRFLLEQVAGPEGYFTFAYVGVEDEDKIKEAISTIDLFLLTSALSNDVIATYHNVIGTDLPSLEDLGKNRAAYNTGYETIKVMGSMPISLNPLPSIKERFLELNEDRQKILGSYLGLALRYYYFAIQSYLREPKRIDEMIIDLSISAETLFSTGANFKKNLKHRLSHFLANNDSNRSEISKTIGNFYDYRGAIVHGRTKKKKISLKEIIHTKNYIQKAIDKALSLRLFLKKELIEYSGGTHRKLNF